MQFPNRSHTLSVNHKIGLFAWVQPGHGGSDNLAFTDAKTAKQRFHHAFCIKKVDIFPAMAPLRSVATPHHRPAQTDDLFWMRIKRQSHCMMRRADFIDFQVLVFTRQVAGHSFQQSRHQRCPKNWKFISDGIQYGNRIA